MNWSGLSTLDGIAAGTGTFTIDSGATLNISGSATKTLNHYNFINTGTANWTASGALQSIGSTFTNSSTLNIGSPTGIANLSVNFIQTSDATLNIDISGASTFDQLKITGNATLAGKLNLTLNNFVPASGNTFQILSASSLSGTFMINSPLFTVAYDNNAVILTAL
jgi:hypothetical protein